MKPPKPKKPRMLKTSTSMPQVCRWLGLRRSSTADMVMKMQQMRPNIAIAPTKPAAREPGLPVYPRGDRKCVELRCGSTTMLTVTRNMSTSTIRAPPTSASIEGMFGYSTAVFDDILDLLPPALLCVEDEGNTLGETILIQPVKGWIGTAHKAVGGPDGLLIFRGGR